MRRVVLISVGASGGTWRRLRPGSAALDRVGLPVIHLFLPDDKPEGVSFALHDQVHVHVRIRDFGREQEIVLFAVSRIAADVDDLGVDADLIHWFGEDQFCDLLRHQIHVLHDARGQTHSVSQGGLGLASLPWNGSPASTVAAAKSERMK